MRGYAKLRAEKDRKRRLPFQILAAVLIVGAGGKLIHIYRNRLATAADSVGDSLSRWADDIRDPRNYAPKPADAPPPPSAEPPVAAAEKPPAAAAARPVGPKPLVKNAWRVSGTLYDLATLDPVPGAAITFLRDGNEPAAATTDEKGAYEIDLAKADGWTVRVHAANYRRGQILDIDPPYRLRDADERHAALEHLTDGDLAAAPVGWRRADSKVRLELVAVPQSWTDAPQR